MLTSRNKSGKIDSEYKKHEAEIMEKAAKKEEEKAIKPYKEIVSFINDMVGGAKLDSHEIKSISKAVKAMFDVKILK